LKRGLLGFTINSYGEDVEREDQDDEDGDPGCRGDRRTGITVAAVPIPYNRRGSTEFGTLGERVGVPLIPTCG